MRIPRNTGPFLILLVIACLVASAAPATAKMRVGDHRPAHITSALDYKGSPDGELYLAWEEVIQEPGATYVGVHFTDFRLASGDYLRISDPTGGQAYVLEDRGKMNAGEFWAQHIKGDTAVLQLFVRNPAGAQGFYIDAIAFGDRDISYDPEAICGTDDKRNAVCYESSHPEAYAASRPVARLLINSMYLCTGWLASAQGHFVTNQHCVASASEALNTDFDFMAQAENCTDSNCQLCHSNDVYSGASFIQANSNLDYALLQFTGLNPAVDYGYMQIDDRDAILNEEIFIPQHPSGYGKELGIESSSDGDGLCHVNSIDAPACTGVGYYDVGYYCDTEGGSSGSPVLAMSNQKVIALHHCGTCLNRGVPIDLVYAEISSYLGPECQNSGDCDDGVWCNGAETCVEQSCEDGNPPCTVDEICDEDNTLCIPIVCDYDDTCEEGEDCNGCPSDCDSGTLTGTCGNTICETGMGETCRTCPADCNGVRTGAPNGRYCCGDDVGCGDARCTGDGNTCSTDLGGSYCCGDLTCTDPPEDSENCALDCGAGPFCGDGTCDSGAEDQCNCAADCGTPPTSEIDCDDGIDNDCLGDVDCDDGDCIDDPACICSLRGESCDVNEDCCSLRCFKDTYCK